MTSALSSSTPTCSPALKGLLGRAPDVSRGSSSEAAYDKAMQTSVFDPLGMTSTTFDYDRAMAGNFANAHAPDKLTASRSTALSSTSITRSFRRCAPREPRGAMSTTCSSTSPWSLPKGLLRTAASTSRKRRSSSDARRKVPIGNDAVYGMGLMVDTTYGIPVVHHGGDMIGYHSDMMWLPDHDVGAVILTNGDPGWQIRSRFQRKLLEVLFDGEPLADKDLAADAQRYFESIAAERKLMTIPADLEAAGTLAAKYGNSALGEIEVSHVGDDQTVFDFGEWQSEVASRTNPG